MGGPGMGFKVQDHYYRRAKQEGWEARSVYKLEEIDRRFYLFRRGDIVVDLGCHPGSWSRYAASRIGPSGLVLGVDKKPHPSQRWGDHGRILRRDVFSLKGLHCLGLHQKARVLLSDMAPDTTGIKSVDQAMSLRLVKKVFDLMEEILMPRGACVVKVFQGREAQDFFLSIRGLFSRLKIVRPRPTRSSSKEIFIVGLEYRR